ncbi:hypothetical protein A1Q1_02793 [Trichosporon asahii var. asahii CBS 2479]|uniref:CN hydrolase domain-containing protein n=1 Tax=Trichosporon asahii var. asahii (strain ATCC 90039 / CBS 2479 / JCM 2466 / KCTC 7840 / NBRC 103889/ NCYC 2677 / UAMH 7654) TaxID=1186058 RepID=J6EZC9_TRIAS|nr:hypothetical protein A1Q1_02793 [Trichosporon asahii var. asahii CBS 2479]EJT48227.1 hypothetical protein A1Q1_02793 [Trichosporon asahii var. asahii CBS 2479]
MTNKIRIALAQTNPISVEVDLAESEKDKHVSPFPTLEHNLVDAARAVKDAAERGADVVVFPEYFLQGFVNEGRQRLAKSHRVGIVGSIVHGVLPETTEDPFPTSDPFTHLSAECSLPDRCTTSPEQQAWIDWLARNMTDKVENAGHPQAPILHNTAFYIDENGELIGELYLTPGEVDNKAFDTKWGKAGFLISQALADQGVKLIFAPTYWLSSDSQPYLDEWPHAPDYEYQLLQALCFTRSVETETVYIMVNPGQPTGATNDHMGGSGVWSPLRGKVEGSFEGHGVGTNIVEIDLDVLGRARELYKVQEDWKRTRK